jgi:hypothetical protein
MGLDGVRQPYFPAAIAGEKFKNFPLTDANDGDAKPASQLRSPEALRFVNTVPHSLPAMEDIRRTFSARASAETESQTLILIKP